MVVMDQTLPTADTAFHTRIGLMTGSVSVTTSGVGRTALFGQGTVTTNASQVSVMGHLLGTARYVLTVRVGTSTGTVFATRTGLGLDVRHTVGRAMVDV